MDLSMQWIKFEYFAPKCYIAWIKILMLKQAFPVTKQSVLYIICKKPMVEFENRLCFLLNIHQKYQNGGGWW